VPPPEPTDQRALDLPDGLPNRVLLVLHEEGLGGASRGALRALEPLVEAGLDLRIWCARPSPLYDHLSAAGFSVAGAPRPLRYSLARLREPPGAARRVATTARSLTAFRRHLRALRPDLVHANATLSLPEALVARTSGFPVLVHYHDSYHDLEGASRKWSLVRGAVWRVGHDVAAISRSTARPLEHGVRSPHILPEPVSVPVAPASRLKPPGSPLVVATVGALGPRKGTDLFIDAAERLAGMAPKLEFHLIGGAEDAPSQQWAAEQLARARAAGVVYRERVDVEAELPGWDIVVVPSRREPFGLVVVEAMAAGRAVIGARVDGIAETLADGGGVLVAPGDGGALAEAIADLAQRPERRAELGAQGYGLVARYDSRRAAERLARVYVAVLGTAALKRRNP
jgi:glycosyltransferase involved in cell wall biosynthesis